MQIKEVEQATGLSAKSIRLYESKGLILVSRKKENQYREYTEENVIILKKIKILRFLEFSIEEIKSLLQLSEEEFKQEIAAKCQDYDERIQDLEIKKNICHLFAKDYNNQIEVIEEYGDFIKDFESGKVDDFRDKLLDIACDSIVHVILESLIFLGPILNLFIVISEKRYDELMKGAIFSIFGTACLVFIWMNYFRFRMENKQRQSRKNAGAPGILFGIILAIVLSLAAFWGVESIKNFIMAPEGWLVAAQPEYCMALSIVLIELPVIAIIFIALGKRNKDEISEIVSMVWNKKWAKTAIAILWIIGFYVLLFSVSYADGQRVIYRNPLHPGGISYSYNHVTKIKTGFGNENMNPKSKKNKGEFFYYVTFGNRTIDFSSETPNEAVARYDDTYLEIEELDAALMKYQPQKVSMHGSYRYCDMDKHYVNRYLRIIDNK